MRRYDTLIFDLDGTLLDSLADLAASTNYALAQMGFPLRTLDEIRTFVGNGMAKLVSRSLPEGASEADFDQCFVLFRANYDREGHPRTAPYPGVLDLLTTLKAQGYTMGVVSNKMNDPVQTLCAEHFPGIFDATVGELPGLARKPQPDLVHHCLALLGATSDRAVYIGDSEVDVATAKNSGLPSIAVTWGFRDPDFLVAHGATTLVSDTQGLFAELV